MPRIVLSTLAAALMIGVAATVPASGNDTLTGSAPTACDCSNCSAEGCQPPPPPPRGGSTFTLTFNGQTTGIVDPNSPTVVYAGGQKSPATDRVTGWDKTQEQRSGQ